MLTADRVAVCQIKIAYPSAVRAWRAVKHGAGPRAYHCKACGLYHLTRNARNERAERGDR